MTEASTVETFAVDLVCGKLYQSRVVRKALANVLKPLARDGIDHGLKMDYSITRVHEHRLPLQQN